MLFLDVMENNEHFRSNKFSPGTWGPLTRSLNSFGGVQKSTNAWNRVRTRDVVQNVVCGKSKN